MKLKIQAIRKKNDAEAEFLKVDLDGKGKSGVFDGFSYDMETKDKSKALVSRLLDNPKDPLTEVKLGVTNKQLVVPSFATTAKVFGQHLLVLADLKYRIKKLKQSYYGQQDKKKSWM